MLDGARGQSFVCAVSISEVTNRHNPPRGDDPRRRGIDRAIVGKLQELAGDLGGQLEAPRLRWKYDWIRQLFGWGPAKRAKLALPELNAFRIRSWDRKMYDLERLGRRETPRGRKSGN